MNKSRAHGRSANTADLRFVFVARVHQLLEMGYQRMNATALATQDEPVITGELARAMNGAIDDECSPNWIHYFHVQDEEPVNAAERKGKYRKRIDIGVRSSWPRPRNHFSFEAKLLNRKKRLSEYLGREGLQCFLKTEYAADEQDAGLLGYVQSDTEEIWAASLQEKLRKAEVQHGVCDGCFGREHRFRNGPAHTYHSRHLRAKPGSPIDIYHTFLSFQ